MHDTRPTTEMEALYELLFELYHRGNARPGGTKRGGTAYERTSHLIQSIHAKNMSSKVDGS